MGEGDEEEGVEEEGGVVLPCVSCARVRRDAVGGGRRTLSGLMEWLSEAWG